MLPKNAVTSPIQIFRKISSQTLISQNKIIILTITTMSMEKFNVDTKIHDKIISCHMFLILHIVDYIIKHTIDLYVQMNLL